MQVWLAVCCSLLRCCESIKFNCLATLHGYRTKHWNRLRSCEGLSIEWVCQMNEISQRAFGCFIRCDLLLQSRTQNCARVGVNPRVLLHQECWRLVQQSPLNVIQGDSNLWPSFDITCYKLGLPLYQKIDLSMLDSAARLIEHRKWLSHVTNPKGERWRLVHKFVTGEWERDYDQGRIAKGTLL